MTYILPPRAFDFPQPVRQRPQIAPQRTAPSVFFPALGLDLVNCSAEAAIETALAPGKRRLCFINAHCCNVMQRDADYRQAVETADMRLPDGVGVALGARLTGQRIAENLNGTDFVPRLLTEAARRGRSVFLVGGTPGTAAAAAARLLHDLPWLKIAGTLDGYADVQNAEWAVDQINESGADIVLVAMGVPLQEKWLEKHAEYLNASLTLGVGALFDFLAGKVARAPKVLRRARLEWLWRFAQEPRRLATRYIYGNPLFIARACWSALLPKDRKQWAQRAQDIVISASALLLLAPLFVVMAALIRLDSKGKALFRQTRIGQDGTPFEILKFRSMYHDAEARRAAVLAISEREGVCFKAQNDPRITRIGRILRRTSLDELPQLMNVFRGDMSIVGPRPALPSEVAAYRPRDLERLAVKPGITGLWQVSGRADIGFDKMVDMDIAYAKSRSVLLDLVLMALTFRAVLSARGAY